MMAKISSGLAALLPSLLICFLTTTSVKSGRSDGDPMIMMKEMMEDMGRPMPEGCFTPPDLQEIFLRACRKVVEDSDRCPTAWAAFTSAFGFKNPNNITQEDYGNYFNVLPIFSSPNSVVFWSGVQGVVEEISAYPNISSSANEDASNIINTMTADDGVECWCGNESAILDTVNPCPPSVTAVFWQEFSCRLGESATGIAYWVGYGDRTGGAYQSSSFFANYEFPKLIPKRVKRLAIINIHECGKDIGENCGEGTLRRLQRQAERKYGRRMGAECYEVCGNPWDEKQVSSISNDTLEIIREEQKECSLRQRSLKIRIQIRSRLIKYVFSVDHPCVTYQCKFDDERFMNCTSPILRMTSSLSRGRHKLIVMAECEANDSRTKRRMSYRIP